MKTKTISYILGITTAVFFATSCNTGKIKDNNTKTTFTNGIFVMNEGNFGNGTATITFYDKKTSTVQQDVFAKVNTYALGNVGQSLSIDPTRNEIQMVINNANKVEKANLEFFGVAPVLTGFNSPRYYTPIQAGKAYVSQWGNGGKVMVVNPSLFKIVDSITVGEGAENIIVSNGLAYIACSGGFGYNNQVAVINTSTDKVVKSLYAGPCPESMQIDANGKLWVLCQGLYNSSFTGLDSNARLVKINLFTNSIENSIDLGAGYSLAHDLKMDVSKSKMYFVYSGKTYTMAINGASPSVFINRDFYTLAVDPANGTVLGGDAGDYVSNGKIYIHNPTNAKLVDSFTAGIIPGDIIFN
jgi:hypothetical protein